MNLPTLKNRSRSLWALVALVGMGSAAVAWASLGSPPFAASSSPILAKVNGKPISRAAFERVWTETREAEKALDMQENRQLVLDSMIGAELLAQQARSDNQLMADTQLQSAMEMQSRNLLANAYASEYLRRNPVTEADLKAAYDQLVKDLGNTEYHIAHILVPKQEDAEALYARIARAEISFAKATESSKPGDGRRAGDLGWQAQGRLPPGLREAVAALNGGPGLLKPFADNYGWHVAQVDEVRAIKVPTLEQSRAELVPMAQRLQLRNHLAQLKEHASIKY